MGGGGKGGAVFRSPCYVPDPATLFLGLLLVHSL